MTEQEVANVENAYYLIWGVLKNHEIDGYTGVGMSSDDYCDLVEMKTKLEELLEKKGVLHDRLV